MRESFKNDEKFRSLIDEISDGIIALDTVFRIVYLNRTAERILNCNADGLTEKNLWEVFPGAVGGNFYLAYKRAIVTQKKTIEEGFSKVLQKWTRIAIYPSLHGLIVYLQDITNEKNAEIRARKSEDDYRLFLDRITDGFIVLDKEFRYVYVNYKVGELFQRPPQSFIGKKIWQEFPDSVNSFTFKAFQTAFKEQRFISNIDYYEPLQLWFENYIYPSPEGLSIFIKDISERKKLELELHKKEREQQFELMVTALESQEKERTLIGRELHDNVNQLLVASKLMLTMITEVPQNMQETVFRKCLDHLEKAIEENRRLSHELVSPDLEEESLIEQLQKLTHTMFTSCNVKTSIQSSSFCEKTLDNCKKLAVYRIAQEQCTNIITYAQAQKVTITLSNPGNVFIMTISDDGIGMEKSKLSNGIGLRNIGTRVAVLHGEVNVHSEPGKGFELQITLPTDTDVTAPMSTGTSS